MTNHKEIAEAEIAAYMAAQATEELPTEIQRKKHILSRHQMVRDMYMFRKLQKEEFEAYRDKDLSDRELNKLQKQFRENYIERLTVVSELRKMGEKVEDPLIPVNRKNDVTDKIEEAEVLAYMSLEGPETELATPRDRQDYYEKRYGEVRDAYKYLKLQQEEAEKYIDKVYRENIMSKLKKLYRENFVERMTVVTALRQTGQKVDDPFIPLSKS